jgi:phage tail-like protein
MATFTKDGGRHQTDGADWLQVNRFEFEVEGISIGEFQEVQLPEVEMEQIEYHVGTSKQALKRPGQKKVGDLVLKRGYNHSSILQDWFNRIANGEAERRSMTAKMLDEQNAVIASFNFYNCWPKKWKLASLDASKGEIQVEEVTFALEDFEKA